MKFLRYNIAFQEVPDEISLAFSITGCRLACKGCHSTDLWNPKTGTDLTDSLFYTLLSKYKNLISCVLFFGGEWHKRELISKLKIAKDQNLKTCLYTGEDNISTEIIKELDYVKLGKWEKELGSLSSPTSNQRFIQVNTNKVLNEYFI